MTIIDTLERIWAVPATDSPLYEPDISARPARAAAPPQPQPQRQRAKFVNVAGGGVKADAGRQGLTLSNLTADDKHKLLELVRRLASVEGEKARLEAEKAEVESRLRAYEDDGPGSQRDRAKDMKKKLTTVTELAKRYKSKLEEMTAEKSDLTRILHEMHSSRLEIAALHQGIGRLEGIVSSTHRSEASEVMLRTAPSSGPRSPEQTRPAHALPTQYQQRRPVYDRSDPLILIPASVAGSPPKAERDSFQIRISPERPKPAAAGRQYSKGGEAEKTRRSGPPERQEAFALDSIPSISSNFRSTASQHKFNEYVRRKLNEQQQQENKIKNEMEGEEEDRPPQRETASLASGVTSRYDREEARELWSLISNM